MIKTMMGAAAIFLLSGGGAFAGGTLEKACLATGAASGNLCQCIQHVADVTLTHADQKRAAKFFVNPDRAQTARASDSQTAEAFWNRYSTFASTAETACAPTQDGNASG